jgi:hypothetical protein
MSGFTVMMEDITIDRKKGLINISFIQTTNYIIFPVTCTETENSKNIAWDKSHRLHVNSTGLWVTNIFVVNFRLCLFHFYFN